MNNHERIVIIGAGHAGIECAISLREEGFTGKLTLLEEQGHLPYQRPPLSKDLLNDPQSDVSFRPERFYDTANIELIADEEVLSIHRQKKYVQTTNASYDYDHLVFATGAESRKISIPGDGASGIYELRSLDDARELYHALEGAENLVVVGGGFIGMEVAASAREKGITVSVVEYAPRVMMRALSELVSLHCQDIHRQNGIDLHLGAGVTEFQSNEGRVSGVALSNGAELVADVVVVGVGVMARTELAESAGLVVDNGIVVDEFLCTSDPYISAIGDCANFPSPNGDSRIRLESVQNATDHAHCVAKRLTGHPEPYISTPWFWSNQGKLRLQMAGTAGDQKTNDLTLGDPSTGKFTVLRFRNDSLVCAESINKPGDHIAIRKILNRNIPLSPAEVNSPTFSIKEHTKVKVGIS